MQCKEPAFTNYTLMVNQRKFVIAFFHTDMLTDVPASPPPQPPGNYSISLLSELCIPEWRDKSGKANAKLGHEFLKCSVQILHTSLISYLVLTQILFAWQLKFISIYQDTYLKLNSLKILFHCLFFTLKCIHSCNVGKH
jgi:hypothetical protein